MVCSTARRCAGRTSRRKQYGQLGSRKVRAKANEITPTQEMTIGTRSAISKRERIGCSNSVLTEIVPFRCLDGAQYFRPVQAKMRMHPGWPRTPYSSWSELFLRHPVAVGRIGRVNNPQLHHRKRVARTARPMQIAKRLKYHPARSSGPSFAFAGSSQNGSGHRRPPLWTALPL